MKFMNTTSAAVIAAAALMGMASQAKADIQHLDDVIITFSLCVGNDCNNGENFGFDTLRLKENNLRIHFNDTSVSASFPTRDWRIVVNDTSNGGANYFAIEDSDAGRIPFRILADAPNNSLYVAANGNVGMGTASPLVQLHVTDGNTPTMRLHQDGTSGFTSQIWDVGGNEANFFVRDVTNGSRLGFRIEPSTPQDTLYLDSTGNVGLGTSAPTSPLHVTSASASMARFAGAGTKFIHLTSNNSGGVQFRLESDSQNRRIVGLSGDGSTKMTQLILADSEIRLTGPSDVWATIDASGITTVGPTCNPGPCDLTFDPEYFQVPSIEDHAAAMWENRYLDAVGPTSPHEPFNVTQKAGGMLHELEVAHIYIEQLNTRLAALEQQVAEVQP